MAGGEEFEPPTFWGVNHCLPEINELQVCPELLKIARFQSPHRHTIGHTCFLYPQREKRGRGGSLGAWLFTPCAVNVDYDRLAFRLMLAWVTLQNAPPTRRWLQRFLSSSPLGLMHRMERTMSTTMKDRWTEDQVESLPAGEHDFFERKSGELLISPEFRKDMGKAISALANSGGGHVLLGVRDDGAFDGVEPVRRGRTSTRDWLEQVVPNLVSFPLHQFRVHEVERSSPSSIPDGRVVVVIDVGDSPLAPHQAAESSTYFYRQGGRSVPAPHFYLETLRNRLVGPELRIELHAFKFVAAHRMDHRVFVQGKLSFILTNVGRVAAYRWEVVLERISANHPSRQADYILWPKNFPTCARRQTGGIRLDATILPSLRRVEETDFGFFLNIQRPGYGGAAIGHELNVVMPDGLEIAYRVVSETSPGEVISTRLAPIVDRNELRNQILEAIRLPAPE